jgi:hypothetical protein
MDRRDSDGFRDTPVLLAVFSAIAIAAGFAMVAAWFALLVLGPPGPATGARDSCSVCGVVQRVDEHERATHQMSGDKGEGIVALIAALGGAAGNAAPAKVYETAVLHDDGSVRVLRDSSEPQWKRGDRVRVIKGRVEPGAR